MGVVKTITKEEFLELNPGVQTLDSDKFFSIQDSGQAIVGATRTVEFYNLTRDLTQKEEFDLLAALSPRMVMDADNLGDELMGTFDDGDGVQYMYRDETKLPQWFRFAVFLIAAVIATCVAMGTAVMM